MLAAGVQAQQITYNVVEDDPDRYKPLAIMLDPFYADAHNTNMTLGWSVRADVLLLGRVEGRFDFRKAYLDMEYKDEDYALPYAKNGLQKHTYMEAGASLFLFTKYKTKNLKITLSKTRSGNYETERYFMAPGTVKRLFGVRGGVSYLSSATQIEEKVSIVDKSDGNNKVPIGGFGVNADGSATYQIHTQLRTATLYAGLHIKAINRLFVEVDGWGSRGHARYADFYLDALFAPVVSLQDVKTRGGKEWSVEGDGIIQRLGWRAGFSFRSPDRVWLSYKFEFGSRPGYKTGEKLLDNQKAFLMLGMGISLPFKAGRIEDRIKKK